jgi:hypothetical protein
MSECKKRRLLRISAKAEEVDEINTKNCESALLKSENHETENTDLSLNHHRCPPIIGTIVTINHNAMHKQYQSDIIVSTEIP